MNFKHVALNKDLSVNLMHASGKKLRKIPAMFRNENIRKSADASVDKQSEGQFERLEGVVGNANLVLFHAKTIFPFQLFPSEIVIDPMKLTVISKDFFVSGQTQSVYIKDILDVIMETGPFFSSLRIIDIGYIQNKLSIKYLLRKDASCARQILEGLLAGTKAGVDFSRLKRGEILKIISTLKTAGLSAF